MDKISAFPKKAQNGTVWDEKGRDQVAGIYVCYNKNRVNSIQFLFYDKNGNIVKSEIHGETSVSTGTANFSAVLFDYPSEFLTSISGSHEIVIAYDGFLHMDDEEELSSVLSSIKFGTNKCLYGPFGSSTGSSYSQHFNFQIGNRHLFGGFHGTKKSYCIESIGVYVKTNTSSIINPNVIPKV